MSQQDEYDPNTRTPWKLRKNGPPVSNDTVFATTLGCALAIIVAIVSSTWALRGKVEEFNQRVGKLEDRLSYDWTVYDQQNWAGDLRARNPQITVGEPRNHRYR